jgi:hypothetical protein
MDYRLTKGGVTKIRQDIAGIEGLERQGYTLDAGQKDPRKAETPKKVKE